MPICAHARVRRAAVLAVVMTAGVAVATSTSSPGAGAAADHAAPEARPAAAQFAPLARRGPGPPPARLLGDLACTSSTYCVGVGGRQPGTGHQQPLAEIFDGKGW